LRRGIALARRELSLFDCVMLGVGSALGPEIFILLGLAAAVAGVQAILSIGIAFAIALLIGLCYAELATAMPRSGEDYIFARQAFHGMLPFLVGWIVWFGNIVYVAFNAIAIAYFLRTFIQVPVGLTAVLFILVAGMLLYLGLSVLKRVQNFMVVLLVTLLAAFVYAGTSVGDWSFLPSILSGNVATAFSTAAFLFVAFIGFEDIVSVSSEIREPRKTLPRAIVITLVVLAAIYLAVALTVFAILPLPAIAASGNAVLDAAQIVLGENGRILLSIAGLLAIATSINAAMTAGTMNAFALGRDAYLPRALARLSSRGTAVNAVAITAAIAIVFAASEAVAVVAYLTDFAYFIAMAVSAYALIKLRERQPYLSRAFSVPFYPYIPVAAIVLSIASLIFLHPQSLLIGALWLLAGVFAYYLYVIGMHRVLIAAGGVLLFLSAVAFTAYFLLEAGYFAIPQFESFSTSGMVLLAALALMACGAYLIICTGKPVVLSRREE